MFPLELIEQFARGNGSVFVGAGLSKGAELPDWTELMEPLVEYVGCPKHTYFPDIAQYYENLTSRQALIEHLLQALDEHRVDPTEVHEKLVNLPVPRIFTTNFDSLLEKAFEKQALPYRRILTDEHLAFMDNAQKLIVKLHGDLQFSQTLVITSGDYDSYFSKHPGVANLLGMDLHSRTVLFLGYSFNDIDLRMILSRVGRVAGDVRRNLFTIQLNPTSLAEKELNRRGVRVIGLQAEPSEATMALGRWLEEFIRRVRESAVRQPAAFQLFATISFINCNLKPRSDEFEFSRKDELARVLDGLLSRYPLIAIKGFAGVGKTSLATEIVRTCSLKRSTSDTRAVIFEYIVWISAEDRWDQKRFLDDVFNAIATTTNNPAIKQEQDIRKKEEDIAQLLRCYKILVVIDNFETVEDDSELIAWLERIPYPSKVLITTRDSRSGPERIAAWTVNLKGLDTAEAVDLLRRHLASQELTEQTLHELARVTDGNPQAMKLTLGLVQDGIADLEEFIKQLDNPEKNPHRIFQELLSGSWERLFEPARQILRVTPLFVGVSSILRYALQAATGLSDTDFSQGLDQCLRFGLLEEDHGRYVIHPITRAFARHQLNTHKEWEREARRRCTKYFLKFVQERVVRPKPKPPYWNALVSVRMTELNPEWPSIQQVMTWADEEGEDEDLIKLVMLLVHYMDSQCLNRERLEHVEKAVAALQRLGRQEEEALLRIDALGWTYVEVLELDKAREEISHGLDIARGEDLRALGLAWRARVRVERKDPGRVDEDFAHAEQLIRDALTIKCSPWIRFRVNMAAGDIALKRGGRENAKAALKFYQRAAKEADSYGGEGYGYQTGPRIGLAHLELGQIEEAERKFKELVGLEQIPIGKLYAEYGQALVERERGNPEKAQVMLTDVKAKLSRHAGRNLLRRLIEEQEARMQGSQEIGDLEPSLSAYD